jgi:hypothetical protein
VNEEGLAHWGLSRHKEKEEWHEGNHILVETFRPVILFNKALTYIIVNGN